MVLCRNDDLRFLIGFNYSCSAEGHLGQDHNDLFFVKTEYGPAHDINDIASVCDLSSVM